MDDILDIDAPSFAARTGHVAAAEIYGLLSNGETAEANWLGARAGVPLGAALSALSLFLVAQKVDRAETLWREALSRGYLVKEARTYGELPFARQLAFETFTRTVAQAHGAIHALQERSRLAAAAAAQVAAVPALKRADSIFEEHEPIDALIEGGAEFLAAQHRRLDRRKFDQPAGARQKDASAEPAAFDGDGDGRPGGSLPKSQRPKTRAIGDAVARAPVNRGGRGNRKSARDRTTKPV